MALRHSANQSFVDFTIRTPLDTERKSNLFFHDGLGMHCSA